MLPVEKSLFADVTLFPPSHLEKANAKIQKNPHSPKNKRNFSKEKNNLGESIVHFVAEQTARLPCPGTTTCSGSFHRAKKEREREGRKKHLLIISADMAAARALVLLSTYALGVRS